MGTAFIVQQYTITLQLLYHTISVPPWYDTVPHRTGGVRFVQPPDQGSDSLSRRTPGERGLVGDLKEQAISVASVAWALACHDKTALIMIIRWQRLSGCLALLMPWSTRT